MEKAPVKAPGIHKRLRTHLYRTKSKAEKAPRRDKRLRGRQVEKRSVNFIFVAYCWVRLFPPKSRGGYEFSVTHARARGAGTGEDPAPVW